MKERGMLQEEGRWYVMKNLCPKKNEVIKKLDEAGIRNQILLQLVNRIWNGENQELWVPLIPHYVFVHATDYEQKKSAYNGQQVFMLDDHEEKIQLSDSQLNEIMEKPDLFLMLL